MGTEGAVRGLRGKSLNSVVESQSFKEASRLSETQFYPPSPHIFLSEIIANLDHLVRAQCLSLVRWTPGLGITLGITAAMESGLLRPGQARGP